MVRRHFGTVRKLPSGRWQARYRDGSGHLVSAPGTFATKGDAYRFLATVEADLARGQYLDPRAARLTIADWANEWLKRPGKKSASVARDRQGLEALMPMLHEGGKAPVRTSGSKSEWTWPELVGGQLQRQRKTDNRGSRNWRGAGER